MITKAWFIVAVMSGVYTDGTKDIFIFNNPLEHGVKPVTKGIRKCLIAFMEGPAWR